MEKLILVAGRGERDVRARRAAFKSDEWSEQ